MKRALVILSSILLFGAVAAGVLVGKDTGTYEIPEYRVLLQPREDGVVCITYYQMWKVTGGHIPWVTVGAYNPDFSIAEDMTGGNISRIRPNNSRSWYGVRIDLDKDYLPGDLFEVEYTIYQKGLFSSDGDYYSMRFTPGWYDRGRIGKLTVEVEFFADLKGIKAGPQPDQVETRRLKWERTRLSAGTKFPVSVSFPKSLFTGKIDTRPEKSTQSSPSGGSNIGLVLLLCMGIPVIVIIVAVLRHSTKGGRYGGGGRIGQGGTRYFGGGCVVSCACACVACACACACAGGGAAGCDRKLTQSCPLCASCEKTDCPLKGESSC